MPTPLGWSCICVTVNELVSTCLEACSLVLTIECFHVSLQLLDTKAVGVRREKMYKLDDHICCAVAGITGEGSDDSHCTHNTGGSLINSSSRFR